MRLERQLRRILDRDQPFLARNLPHQRLGQRRLPRARRPRHDDVLARAHREPQERHPVPRRICALPVRAPPAPPAVPVATQRSNTPPAASSSSPHARSPGRRIVIATVPAVAAGGSTTCTRSPDGNAADSSGDSALTRCLVAPATSRANDWHQLKLANGAGSRRPAPRALDVHLARPIDAELGHRGVAEPRPQPLDILRQRRAIADETCHGHLGWQPAVGFRQRAGATAKVSAAHTGTPAQS